MIRSSCSSFHRRSSVMGWTSVRLKLPPAISVTVQEEGWRMHRPLPCQDVVLASYMQIVGGHLLPQGIKKAPFVVNDAELFIYGSGIHVCYKS